MSTPQERVVELVKRTKSLIAEGKKPDEALDELELVTSGFDRYMSTWSDDVIVPSTHGVAESEVRKTLTQLFKDTETFDWNQALADKKLMFKLQPTMCSGPYEAAFLQHLAMNKGATSVLEIGLFTGTTTLALALLPCVKRIVSLDIEPFLEEFDRPYWKAAGVSDKIETKIGDGTASLADLKARGDTFDFVYIDADKGGYIKYYEAALEMLAPGGVILVDNTLMKARTYAPSDMPKGYAAGETVHKFNAHVKADERVNVVIVPLRDGVTMIQRKL